MKKCTPIWKSLSSLLLILLLLAYISVAFLPHAHSAYEADCAQCIAIQATRTLLCLLFLCGILSHIGNSGTSIHDTCRRPLAMRDFTPVGLKVKLSD